MKKPSSPYDGIGIDNFYYRYDEVMDYFIAKKKNKADTLTTLKERKAKVFTSHIPYYFNNFKTTICNK